MKRFLHLLLYTFLATSSCKLYSVESRDPPCDKGNFSLPPSQLPGPLVGFGENIIGEKLTQIFLFVPVSLGKDNHYVEVQTNILYGITDNLSILLTEPVAISYRDGDDHSWGSGDLTLELEGVLFSNADLCYSNQWTLVANASAPTGSGLKNPPTGFGAMSYFIGTTYIHSEINWSVFTSYGVELPMSRHGTRYGNQYLYQAGVEWVFRSSKSIIFAGLLEIDGTFYGRDKVHGSKAPNSGGNLVYVTPSLWLSSQTWILQAGCGFAVQQHLFGNQTKSTIFPVLQVRKTF